jgi:hypothetical protein
MSHYSQSPNFARSSHGPILASGHNYSFGHGQNQLQSALQSSAAPAPKVSSQRFPPQPQMPVRNHTYDLSGLLQPALSVQYPHHPDKRYKNLGHVSAPTLLQQDTYEIVMKPAPEKPRNLNANAEEFDPVAACGAKLAPLACGVVKEKKKKAGKSEPCSLPPICEDEQESDDCAWEEDAEEEKEEETEMEMEMEMEGVEEKKVLCVDEIAESQNKPNIDEIQENGFFLQKKVAHKRTPVNFDESFPAALSNDAIRQVAKWQPDNSILRDEDKLIRVLSRFSEGNFYNETMKTYLKPIARWDNVCAAVFKTPLVDQERKALYLVSFVIERRFKSALFRNVCLMNAKQLTSEPLMEGDTPLVSHADLGQLDWQKNKALCDIILERGSFALDLSPVEKKKIRADVKDAHMQKLVEQEVREIKKAAQGGRYPAPYFPTLWHKNVDQNWLDRCYYLQSARLAATFGLNEENGLWELCKIYSNLSHPVANGKLLAFNEDNILFNRVERMAVDQERQSSQVECKKGKAAKNGAFSQ